ncbi:unnamed protein product [Coccothraustes coccothraustes]
MGGNNLRRVLTEQKGKQQRIESAASEDERPESLASTGKAKDSRGQHLLMPAPSAESSPHRRPGGGGGAATVREARRPRPAARCLPPARGQVRGAPATPPAPTPGKRLCAILPRHPRRSPPAPSPTAPSCFASLHPSLPPYIPPRLPLSSLPSLPTAAARRWRGEPRREGRCPRTPTLSPAPRSDTLARPRRSEEEGDGEVTER